MKTYQDQLLYNVTGQTLWFDAPEGRPSSVTSVAVYEDDIGDNGSAESATTGSASVETNPNTTVDAASGAGQTDPTKLNVAATAGFEIGRQYLVTGANGESEWFEVTEIATDDYVLTRNPLENAYASSDTVEGTRISISVLDAFIQDENNISDPLAGNPRYRVRWVYVYNSTSYAIDTYFDVVRYKSKHTVTPVDVENRIPGFLNRLPTYSREARGTDLIDAAYTDVVSDLHNLGRAHYAYSNRERMDELVIYRTLMNWARANYYMGSHDLEQYETARRDYYELLDKRVRVVSNVPEKHDTSGAAHKRSALPIAVR